MKLHLDLTTHCIETELRRCYNKALAAYFKAGCREKGRLEQTIELASRALETLNFAKLRTQYPALAGGTDRQVSLSSAKAGFVITIDGQKIAVFNA